MKYSILRKQCRIFKDARGSRIDQWTGTIFIQAQLDTKENTQTKFRYM